MRKRNRTILLICLFFLMGLLVFMSGGCWNRRELDTLAMVMALGIDREKDGQVTLTAQILKPGEVRAPTSEGMGSGSKGVWLVSSTGKTVFDALRNFTFETDRKLFLPFTRVVVIGEEMAKAGVAPVLDFLERDHEFRRLVWVLVAQGQAKEVLMAEHEQEKIPAKAIESLIRASAATSMLPMVNLKDFLAMLASKSSQPFAPLIKVLPQEDQAAGQGGGGQTGGGQEKKVKKTFKTGGTAVFKRDKLIGWLDHTESRGLLWVLGKVKSGIIVVPAPGDGRQQVSLEIIRSKTDIKPEIKDGKLIITVEIKEEGNLGEQMAAGDFIKPEQFQLLEQEQARAIEQEVRAVLRKAQQEWEVDIFKFGAAVHRAYPREWQEIESRWDGIFPLAEVNIKVDAKLRRFGLNTKRVMSE